MYIPLQSNFEDKKSSLIILKKGNDEVSDCQFLMNNNYLDQH